MLVAHTVETFGSVDILVASAGLFLLDGFLDMTEANWDQSLRVNLKGVFCVGRRQPGRW
jgi:NAD(P)-dependent dehydrogenase (short-subunit alcohol dehydrogenase family)